MTLSLSAQSQIITEIMYNPPETGVDSLEYIEFYNNTGEDIQMQDWAIIGVFHKFEPRIFPAGEYLVVAKSRSAFDGVFQAPTIQWEEGALNNSGEEVSLLNPDSVKVSTVRYENGGSWSEMANGLGHSLELCDLTANESDPANWGFSIYETGVTINNRELFGSPTITNETDCEQVGIEYTSVSINEIMFDAPGDDDELEYIEIYNYGGDTVSLSGWTIDGDITYNLPGLSLLPNRSLVIAKNELDFSVAFNTPAFQWPGNQSLRNDVGQVRLFTGVGTLVEEVNYNITDPWPQITPGTAIELCDLFGDHNDGASWQASTNVVAAPGTGDVYGTPGRINKCGSFSIGEITEIDADGVLTKLGDTITTVGVVHGFNFNELGLQFTIIDNANDGIGVFSFDENFGYVPQEGDELTIIGELSQYNGLAQISPSAIILNTTGNLLQTPEETFSLGEHTESQLMKMVDMYIVDPEQWTNEGSGFNVDITNSIDTVVMRIDADVGSIFGLGHPEGTFDLTGIGGQFDSSSPYDSGYQIFPRYFQDIDPYNEASNDTTMVMDLYPPRSIADVTTSNANGLADSLDIGCTLVGIVHGVNFSGSDLIMTIIDPDNNGIGVFNDDNAVGYIVQEGDQVSIQGTIGQFNGLTQIIADSLEILNIGNDQVEPLLYDSATEDFQEVNESSMIRFENVEFVDPSQWAGDGSSFNVDLIGYPNAGETFTLRVDNDTELASMPVPFGGTGLMAITGIQGQFDSSSPFDSGYQILPRYLLDFEIMVNTFDPHFDQAISIYPNPVTNKLNVSTEIEIEAYKIFNTLGQLIKSDKFESQISLSDLPEGSYSILFNSGDRLSNKKFIKL